MDTETPKQPWTSLDQLALVDKVQGKQKIGRLGTGDHIFIVSMFRKPSNHSEQGRARPTDTRRTTPQQIMVKEVSPVYPPLAPQQLPRHRVVKTYSPKAKQEIETTCDRCPHGRTIINNAEPTGIDHQLGH